MDPILAKRIFEEGAAFIFLGVPKGTEFGIDLKSWNTGDRFRGVKMIPPGLHYIFFSSVNKIGDVAVRTGFFHYFKTREVIAKRWDELQEGLSTERVSEVEIERLKLNLKSLDSYLGPYPYDIWDKWKFLTENVSENLTNQLVPLNGEVRSVLELEHCNNASRPRINDQSLDDSILADCDERTKMFHGKSDEELLPNLQPKEGTNLRFTKFPTQVYPQGSSPSQITQHSLDSSYRFEQIINNYDKPTDILGELEFSFICFLVGHCLDAFEQWKIIFSLFCSCTNAIMKHRCLYDNFLNVIELQLTEIPIDFLADIVTNNNIIYLRLRDLFRTIKDSNLIDGSLKSKAFRLRKTLNEVYEWDFSNLDMEYGEDAPVIVQLE